MSTAMSAALSGLKAQQTSLDVIANNISNTSTTGYKAQRVSFSDLLNQTIKSGSSATATTGGTNSVQVGTGTSVGSVDTILTVGSSSSTGVATDVALSGEGYLVVQGGSKGEYQYTRAGNLSIDDAGNITVNGNEVCGWEKYTVDADGNYVYDTNTKAESLNVNTDSYNGDKTIMAAKATTEAKFSGSLDSTKTTSIDSAATADQKSTVKVYDAQGNENDVSISWKKYSADSTNNTTTWSWSATSADGTVTAPSSGYVKFDSDGKIMTSATTSTATVAAGTTDAGYKASNVTIGSAVPADTYTITVSGTTGSGNITMTDTAGNTYTAVTSTDGVATFATASGNISLTAPTSGWQAGTTTVSVASTTCNTTPTLAVTVGGATSATADVNVKLDFSTISTSASSSSSASTVTDTADGYASGERQSIAIGSDGTITGSYSNGKSQAIGKLAVAVFTNAGGLEKIGSNLYAASSNSGDATVTTAGSGGSGSLSSSTLEMSNVDLAQEFSNMMIAQRSYQANSKVISTSDEMMQTIVNMKS